MRDIDPPPFWLKNMRDKFPGFEGKVDRWQIIHFEAPSTIRIDVGVAKAGTGAPEGDRSQGVNGYVMNTITPETDAHVATTSGPSCATTASRARRSPPSCARACTASSARTRRC